MLVKGLYDFYLLSKLHTPGKTKSTIKGYERKYNTYCSFASAAFNHSQTIEFTENLSTVRFKRQFDYLLNHPKIYSVYQLMILYSIRIPIILESFFTAPFSKQSRRYIKKKAGTLSAVRRYFKKLKQEF